MSKELAAVFSQRAVEHNPPPGFFNGIVRQSYDKPERAKVIIDVLVGLNEFSSIEIIQPREFGMQIIYSVHDKDYINFLKSTSEEMSQKRPIPVVEIVDETTQEIKIHEYPAFTYPSVFPHGAKRRTTNKEAIKGMYTFDIATPISANTYELALLAAYTALTGADLLRKGKKLVYSLSRPPGHHSERSRMGSYCYLNNAALAADFLKNQTHSRIGIIDIDAHHGNGTQEIFYSDPKVFYTSIHGDPSCVPPYYSGYADEKGEGAGEGYNLNIPLTIGTNNTRYLIALDTLINHMLKFSPQYLIVSLGFDGYKSDPTKIFNLDTESYIEIARRIRSLDLPTLIVQEGGYFIPALGVNLVAFLKTLRNQNY